MIEAAPTTQTSQSSSAQQGQSTQADGGGQGGESSTTQTTAKPDKLPDTFWDAASGSIKTEFWDDYQSKSDKASSLDARVAGRPPTPDGYALELPKEFKADIPLKFNDKDPRVAALREFGHKRNWTQDDFSEALTLEAQRVIAEDKALKDAQAAQIKNLGANGTARVTATQLGIAAIPGVGAERSQQLMDRMVLSGDFEILEAIYQAFASQGGGALNGKGREPPPPPEKPLTQKLWPNRPLA